MRTTCRISAVALAAALLVIPSAAQAQSLGVDVGQNGSGISVDVNVGGDNGVNAGADVGLGGSSAVSVDAGGSVGGQSSANVDAGVGNHDSLVNANAGAGPNNELIGVEVLPGSRPNGSASTPPAGPAPRNILPRSTRTLDGDIRISALDQAGRSSALLDLIDNPQLADIDLDASIDDRRVIVTDVTALLGEDNLAEIDAALELGSEGRGQLRDALSNSDVLRSILGNEGINLADVLAVQVGEDGVTEVIVLPNRQEAANTGGLSAGNLADLDIEALSDEELAEVDLAGLPHQDQRLSAVLRLLARDPSESQDSGEVQRLQIIDLDALLDDASLAAVNALIENSNEDGTLIQADTQLLAALSDAGVSPDAVAAIRVGPDGLRRLFVTGGDEGNTTNLADAVIDINRGNGASTDGVPALEDVHQLADLDINTLTDEELAEVDLALLPREEQRLNAVLRLLGTDSGETGDAGNADNKNGTVQIVNLDALLGEQSLAEVDGVLANPSSPNSEDPALALDAVLRGALDDEGIDPTTVAAVRVGPTGIRRLFVNNPDGETSQVPDAVITVALGGSQVNDGNGGNSGNNGSPNNGENTGIGENPAAGNGGIDPDGNGNTSGTKNGNGDDGATTLDTRSGSDIGVDSSSGPTPVAVAALTPTRIVPTVADVACDVGLSAIISGEAAMPDDIMGANDADLVGVNGCGQTPDDDSVADIRGAIQRNPSLSSKLDLAGYSQNDVIGVTMEDGRIIVYIDRSGATANS